MIICSEVSKYFFYKKEEERRKITALQKLSFSVPKGEIIGLVGASGAGKTTLLKTLCGLLKPEEGHVRILGVEPIKNRKKISRKVAVLFANMGVLEQGETVAKNLELAGIIYRRSDMDFQKELQELCRLFCLYEILEKEIRELSLGQKRRVELVYLLIQKAEIYLLDEPCIGLDAQARKAFESRMEMLKKAGKTIIISSHDIGQIDILCTRILLLKKGRLYYYGEKEHLYKKKCASHILSVRLEGSMPDLQDLPIKNYKFSEQKLIISYDEDYVKTAEIVEVLLKQSKLLEINIKKLTLEERTRLSIEEEEE